jgi:type I restriction enzyme S subunit
MHRAEQDEFVRNGDVIISTVRTYLQAITLIHTEKENLVVSTGFAVIRPTKEKFYQEFCKYALRESHFLSEVEKRSVGVSYPAINASDLGDIPLKAPSYSNQIVISQYLNKEIAEIDALIKSKNELLKLLSEKRQSLITQAVTKGLNPKAKLKNSGFDWLGEVPIHWKIIRLKYLGNISYGLSQPPEYQTEGLRLLRATNIFRGIIKNEGLVFINENDLSETKM